MFMKKSCLALEVLFSDGFGDDNKKSNKKGKISHTRQTCGS